jgi:hypothetical protein
LHLVRLWEIENRWIPRGCQPLAQVLLDLLLLGVVHLTIIPPPTRTVPTAIRNASDIRA